MIYTSKWLLALAHWLIVARNPATGEMKYFVSNAPPQTALTTLLKVAFTRAGIEHLFRLTKTEVGFSHYEGRNYTGLMRHMTLCQRMLLFAAEQTGRFRGEKSGGDGGAGGAGIEHPVPSMAPAEGTAGTPRTDGVDHPISSGKKSGGQTITPARAEGAWVAL